MRRALASIFAVILTGSQCFAQSSTQQPVFEAIQRSHIDGNVPAAQDFKAQLERDLLRYFRVSNPSTTSVQYKLLRDSPTQTGVALPKYYLWVKALAGTQVQQEGAMRIAAVKKSHFDVTHFLSSSEIKSNPDKVNAIFPAPLVAGVFTLARAQ